MTRSSHSVSLLCISALLASSSAFSVEEDYPSRAVTVVLPSAPGGGPAVIPRIVADRLKQTWKQPVVILTRPGATGIVGAQAIREAKPDGYTLYPPVASNFTVLISRTTGETPWRHS